MAIQRILSLAVLLLVAGILLVATSHSQKPKPVADQGPVVINNTRGFAVISAVRNGGELYIAFRNDYAKTVMAYVISIGNTRYAEDFASSGFAEAGIFPNTTYELRLRIGDSTKPINIAGVILDDGMGDGNTAVLQDTRDQRLGERIQIERALKLLDNYLKLPGKETKAGIDDLKSQIISKLNAPDADSLAAFKQLQPDRPWQSLSEDARNKLTVGKEGILQRFKDVENAQNARDALLKMKEYYERVLRRY